MAGAKDPTDPIRRKAAAFPSVATGSSCNQSAFKVGKGSFLYIGPGTNAQGFKAMFKLDRSMPEARKLAAKDPDRFGVGSTSWVTTRFTAEKPLPKSIWEKWLRESYELMLASKTKGKKKAKKKSAKHGATNSKNAS